MRFVFIGPKSSGKSFKGREFAARRELDFFDVDTVIENLYERENTERLSFRDIYKKVGKDSFRELEAKAVMSLSSKDWVVISTGGSTFLDPKNRESLRQNSIIVMITGDNDVLWSRISKDGIPAYLINEKNPEESFNKRSDFIKEIYTKFADFVIDGSKLTIDEAVDIIENRVEDFMTLNMFSPSSFGELVRVSTFGESHGKGVGVVLDGITPGIEMSAEIIQKELDRRKPGQSKITTKRDESDTINILSGIYDGKTTGTPIAMVIYNKDQDSSKYDNLKEVFRPGHADFGFYKKFGIRDHRGGGRSSGRETIGRVASGAVAKKILKDNYNIDITAYTMQIGKVKADKNKTDFSIIEQNIIRTADADAAKEMENYIMDLRAKGDSVGGLVEVKISGVMPGIGDPVFFKMDAKLAQAVFSIGTIKGVEIGDGFGVVSKSGKENNDPITSKGFETNNSGGILGGITNGDDIILRAAVKPTPSISSEQKTVTKDGKDETITIKGRHDPCIVPRIIPVIESMIALVILDSIYIQEKINPDWNK